MGVEIPVDGGDPFGGVDDVAEVPRLDVDAVPYLVRIDGDDVGELFIVDLVPFSGRVLLCCR